MRNCIMLLGLLFIIISCKNNNSEEDIIPNFQSFIYCYSDMRSNNLIKFLGNDTLFLQRRFPEERIGNYYLILDKGNKNWLNNFLNNLNLKSYDAIYKSSGVEDGCSEAFIMNRMNIESGVYIPNRNGPKEFRNLSIWLKNLKNDCFFMAMKKEIDFGNPVRFYLPSPPPPKIGLVCFKNSSLVLNK